MGVAKTRGRLPKFWRRDLFSMGVRQVVWIVDVVTSARFVRCRSCGTPQVFGGGGAAERKLAFRRERFSPAERYGTYRATPTGRKPYKLKKAHRGHTDRRGHAGPVRPEDSWYKPSRRLEESPRAVRGKSNERKGYRGVRRRNSERTMAAAVATFSDSEVGESAG